MEGVKWILKKHGFFAALLWIFVIISGIALEKRGFEKDTEEMPGAPVVEEHIKESDTELSLWLLPQTENCLFTEAEKRS